MKTNPMCVIPLCSVCRDYRASNGEREGSRLVDTLRGNTDLACPQIWDVRSPCMDRIRECAVYAAGFRGVVVAIQTLRAIATVERLVDCNTEGRSGIRA